MAKSYKFESQPNQLQEVETSLTKIPYELAAPKAGYDDAGGRRAGAIPDSFEARDQGHARMMYLLTGEVVLDGSGMRVLGTGNAGRA